MSAQSGDRYQILDRLDAGGMAEVFKAVAVSLEGFEKPVAIKRVLPQLSANERFIRMFLDEARLSLYLSHTNIVSVFDVVQADQVYFIVMEYIEGANLKRVIEAARLRQGPLPVPIAVYIAIQVCQGLDYAHNKTDPRGRDLNIVHRDVSPPNVLLSWTGEVKLTDFGLAKAASQMSVTDPGVVKGKFGYLSPEAAMGETVDRRTDVFAAGIILWEMLAGRRLFQGNADWDTLQLVRKAEIPSLRALNPSVPVELEEIVRRVLARDPNERFQSAQDFGRRLSGYLSSTASVVTAYDVAAYLKAVLSEPAGPRDRTTSAMLTQVIQQELNQVAPVGFDSSASGPTGLKEDPRNWEGFGFDDGDEPATSTQTATSYASGKGSRDEDSVVIPLSMVRPGQRSDGPVSRPSPAVTGTSDGHREVLPSLQGPKPQKPSLATPVVGLRIEVPQPPMASPPNPVVPPVSASLPGVLPEDTEQPLAESSSGVATTTVLPKPVILGLAGVGLAVALAVVYFLVMQ
jgi:eukaryotic-like serine/threonine-protein kinase